MNHPLLPILDRAVQKCLWDACEGTPFHNKFPVGVNVSGGLDSSTVAALAQRWIPDIPMFTGWYDVPGYSEVPYARLVNDSANHHYIKIEPEAFVAHFDAMMAAFTPPFQGPGMFGQYMVAKAIKAHWRVETVLSGEGSDELFGGYARLIHVAGEKMPDGYENYKPPADYPTDLRAALTYDYARLPDLLKVDDEALGAFGLTAAAPFTDQAVVDYALELPASERVGKRHLREAVRGLVPDPIIDRTDKKGFPVPLVHWANEPGNPVAGFVHDRIGYIPDPDKPFDRAWWLELCNSSRAKAAA